MSDPESQTAAPAAGKAGVPTAAPAPAAAAATTGFDLKPVLRGILKGQLDGSQLMEDMQDWTPKNRAAYVRLYAQDPSKAQTYHAQVTKSLDQTAQEHVLRSLAVLREKAPVQPNGQPWTPDAIVRELKLSGRRQRALTAMKPEDLAGYGVMAKSPEIMEAEAKATAAGRRAGNPEHLGIEFNRYAQQLFKGRDPSTLTPEETERVNAIVEQKRGEVSALQGSAGVTAKAAAERGLPLVQSLKADEHIIDTQTGLPVDRFTTSLEDVQKGGGQKRYAHLGDKQYQQYTSIRESHAIIRAYEEIAAQLTKTPGATFAQALTFYAKTKMGAENPGVALEALRGSVLRLAGAFQGSRAQLSDKDVKAIEGMLPTGLDTMQTARQRLATVSGLLNVMQSVALNRTSPDVLRERLDKLPTPKAIEITGVRKVR